MTYRILFVDDESNVLLGLRRMLRHMRNDWEMEFAESGREALDILAGDSFDLVVADMRMPGMDGAELLNEVMTKHPAVARFILSGQSDEAKIMRCVGQTHQLLSKPCDGELLKAKIERLMAARSFLDHPELRRLISGLTSVPSSRSNHQSLAEELDSPVPSVSRIAKIISCDVGMSAKVLHLVNSAFFGFYRHVSGPKEAANILGAGTLKALIQSEQAFAPYGKEADDDFDVDEMMLHSEIAGDIAKKIACSETEDREIVSGALKAGLLHDVGKIILASHLPDQCRQAAATAREHSVPVWEAEKEVFGATHAEVGAFLLGLWGLPESVVEAIALHHHPETCSQAEFGVLTAVHIADILEHEQNPDTATGPAPKVSAEYLDKTGLSGRLDNWRTICREVERQRSEQKDLVCG